MLSPTRGSFIERESSVHDGKVCRLRGSLRMQIDSWWDRVESADSCNGLAHTDNSHHTAIPIRPALAAPRRDSVKTLSIATSPAFVEPTEIRS